MENADTRAETVRFVRLATLALMSLLLEQRSARYVIKPTAAARLSQSAARRTSREGICGLNLVPRDMRRFWPKVRVTETCWEWQGHVTRNGYGRFRVTDESRLAHRYSYEFFNGELPEGMVVDHLCSNKRCVNPDHLEAVTA